MPPASRAEASGGDPTIEPSAPGRPGGGGGVDDPFGDGGGRLSERIRAATANLPQPPLVDPDPSPDPSAAPSPDPSGEPNPSTPLIVDLHHGDLHTIVPATLDAETEVLVEAAGAELRFGLVALRTLDAAGAVLNEDRAAESEGAVEANGLVRFPNLLPNADLLLRPRHDRLEEILELTAAPTLAAGATTVELVASLQVPAELGVWRKDTTLGYRHFPLPTQQRSAADLGLGRPDGESPFHIPAPTLVDAAGERGGATATVDLNADGRGEYRLEVAAAWLMDPARRYPVRLDPPVGAGPAFPPGPFIASLNVSPTSPGAYTVSLQATAQDGELRSADQSLSWTVEWGDGDSSTLQPGPGARTAEHAYPAEDACGPLGFCDVTLRICDDRGRCDGQTLKVPLGARGLFPNVRFCDLTCSGRSGWQQRSFSAVANSCDECSELVTEACGAQGARRDRCIDYNGQGDTGPSELQVFVDRGSRLNVIGTDGDDRVEIRLQQDNPEMLEVDDPSQGTGAELRVPLADLRLIRLAGGDGDDFLAIDESKGPIAGLVTIELDGGKGDDVTIGGTGEMTPDQVMEIIAPLRDYQGFIDEGISILEDGQDQLMQDAIALAREAAEPLFDETESWKRRIQEDLQVKAEGLTEDAQRLLMDEATRLLNDVEAGLLADAQGMLDEAEGVHLARASAFAHEAEAFIAQSQETLDGFTKDLLAEGPREVEARVLAIEAEEEAADAAGRLDDAAAEAFEAAIDREVEAFEARLDALLESLELDIEGQGEAFGQRVETEALAAGEIYRARLEALVERGGDALLTRAEAGFEAQADALVARAEGEVAATANQIVAELDEGFVPRLEDYASRVAGLADSVAELQARVDRLGESLGARIRAAEAVIERGAPAVEPKANVDCDFNVTPVVFYFGGAGLDIQIGTPLSDFLDGGGGLDLQIGLPGDDRIDGGAGFDLQIGSQGRDRMTGGANTDLMWGGFGDDCMDGEGGWDIMFGFDGDDHICGGDEPDLLVGMRGDDDMEGNDNIDLMFGGPDNDTMRGNDGLVLGNPATFEINLGNLIVGNAGEDTMSGGDGLDVMLGGTENDDMEGGATIDVMLGRQGEDTMRGEDGEGITINNFVVPIGNVMLGQQDADEMDGGIHADFMFGGPAGDIMRGDDGIFDLMLGNDGEDDMSGDDGIDLMFGMLDADLMNGGDGIFDLMLGNPGSDEMHGNEGIDFMFGMQDDDLMFGDGGILDFMMGNIGNDTMSGGDGANGGDGISDIMFGDPGNDTMNGDPGILDLMFGGRGDDTMNGNDGPDLMFGNLDDDLMRGGAGLLDLMFGNRCDDTMFGEDGPDVMFGGRNEDEMHGGPGLLDIMFGGRANDLMFGDEGPDIMFGGKCRDRMFGGTGLLDLMFGNKDEDEMFGQQGADIMFGNKGDDRMFGGPGLLDIVAGNKGDDFVRGEDGSDWCFGDKGSDEVYGDNFLDMVYGGKGIDDLYGGPGADLMGGGAEGDEIRGEDGLDLMFGGGGADTMTGADGSDMVFGGASGDRIYGGENLDFLFGNTGDDLIFGEGGGDVASGGKGDDRIWGGVANDFIFGKRGRDKLFGQDAGDLITGRQDEDVIFGAEGRDFIFGGRDNDAIDGGDGRDWIFGKRGDDVIFGRGDRDWIFAGKDNDEVDGGDDRDRVWGNKGDDRILGGDGNDKLRGKRGNDQLDGQDGNDLVRGNLGDDTLWGGPGTNSLIGGFGSDTLNPTPASGFVFTATECAHLFGEKWNDLDGDGVRDPGEPGLGGVLVYLDLNNNMIFDAGEPHVITAYDDPQTHVDESGEYSFFDLAAGTYQVAEVPPPGTVQSAPAGAWTVVLAADGLALDRDFGNADSCRPSQDGSACESDGCADDSFECAPRCVSFRYDGDIVTSTLISDCECNEPQGCHVVVVDPDVGETFCEGVCPPGFECDETVVTDEKGRVIEKCCDCVEVPDCAVANDGQSCEAVNCDDPGQACVPTCVNYDEKTDVTTVLKCDCLPVGQCHVDMSGGGQPVCDGGCPGSFICSETQDENCNGGVDICCNCTSPFCEPAPDARGCNPHICDDPEQTCIPQKIRVVDACVGGTNDGNACTSDADCPSGLCKPVEEVLECECIDDGCHVDFDENIGPFCVGVCPEDFEACSLIEDNGEFWCECEIEECGPLPDGSACAPYNCDDPNHTCQPRSIVIEPRCVGGLNDGAPCALNADCPGGACQRVPVITDCDCGDESDCHIEVDQNMTPFCEGECPPGETCVLFQEGGEWTCECQELECEPNEDQTACKPFDCGGVDQCIPVELIEIGVCDGGAQNGSPCEEDVDCGPGITCLTSTLVGECDCTPPDICQLTTDADGNLACDGTCPVAGDACVLQDDAGELTCGCAPGTPNCEPTPDQSGCVPDGCVDTTVEECVPTILTTTGQCDGGDNDGLPCTTSADCAGADCVPGSTVVTSCDCEPIGGCQLGYDPAAAVATCGGNCPVGESCTLGQSGDELTCDCQPEQPPEQCFPSADRRSCDQTCSDPAAKCEPTLLIDGLICAGGANAFQPCAVAADCPGGNCVPKVYVEKCDCNVDNECHVALSAQGQPTCTGLCPNGQSCDLDAAGNATFTCGCQ